jgi:hypothetical protein
MIAPAPPPAAAPAAVDQPADVVVVSRDTRSEVLASRDTPLPLIRAGRTEDALLRQAVFLTSTLLVVRPASGAGGEVLRWTYQPYLQRQLCLTSITGQFACAEAVVEPLTDRAAGETPLAATPAAEPGPAAPAPNPAPNPVADAARLALVAPLRAGADALFDADRRLKVDPMLKAARVSIRRIRVPARAVRR